jgi:heme/copper-type cytochrome/quinol oxidase subunit 2
MHFSGTRHRLVPTIVAAVAALTPLTACGGGSSAADAPAVDIQLGRYTITPGDLTVPAGTVSLRVTNVDTIIHNLVVAGRGTRPLAPGATETIQIVTEPGDYRMWCDVQGHAQLGQTGTLRSETVVASTPAPTTAG